MYTNNQCCFIGIIGRDPEMKSLPSGVDIVNSSLAVSQTKEKTTWLNLSAFGSVSAQLFKARKGDKCKVYGELWTREYEDKNGNKRTSVDLTVKGIEVDPKKEKEEVPPSAPGSSDPFKNSSNPPSEGIPF